MCLERLVNFQVKTRVGYKVFSKCHRGLSGLYKDRYTILPKGKWLIACLNRAYSEKQFLFWKFVVPYTTGYHIFLTKQDAINYARYHGRLKIKSIRKVMFGNIVAKGYQDGFRCICAKKMKILEKI